jgi:hypothetical protein
MRHLHLAAAAIAAAAVLDIAPAESAGSSCLAAVQANAKAKSYHSVLTNAGVHATTTVDIVSPDRLRVFDNGVELIAIGNKAWRREGSGPWKAAPPVPVAQILNAPLAAASENGVNCVDAGMGTLDGRPAHIYKSSSVVHGKTVHATFYVLGDGFVHRFEVTSARGGSVMEFSNFNATTIDRPV